MGAYENPSQIVDTKSGAMIGAAISNVGKNIAQGVLAKSKAESKAFAEYEKIKQQNFKIDTEINLNIAKAQNKIILNREKEGYKGVELNSMKKSIDKQFKKYGDALKRTRKATSNYDGMQDDLDFIQKFDLWNSKNLDLFGSIQAFNESMEENIKTGKLSDDTNPQMRIFNGVSKKNLKGVITWEVNDDLEYEATVDSPSIGELDLKQYDKDLDELGIKKLDFGPNAKVERFGNSKYTFNMNRVAEAYNSTENPYNNAYMSTKADVIGNIRKQSFEDNKNENTQNLSAIDDNGKTKAEYLTPAIQTAPMRNPNSANPNDLVTQTFAVPDINKLNSIASTQADQQYNEFSNLAGGINTLRNILMDDQAAVRDGNTFKVTIPGVDGKLATTTKGIRNLTNGKLLEQTTELTIEFPEYDENTSKDKLFTGDFENQIKEYFKFKAFAANGAYVPPTYSEMEEYKGIEVEESEETIYNDLLAKVFSVEGGSLNKDQITDIFATSSPDGALIISYEEYIKDIEKNIGNTQDDGTAFTKEEAQQEIDNVNKDDIFITQGDKPPVAFRKSKNGTYDKNIVATTIRNLFTGEAEQGKADKAIKIEGDKNIKKIKEKIATAKANIEKAKRQNISSARITAEEELKRLQAQLKQIK